MLACYVNKNPEHWGYLPSIYYFTKAQDTFIRFYPLFGREPSQDLEPYCKYEELTDAELINKQRVIKNGGKNSLDDTIL